MNNLPDQTIVLSLSKLLELMLTTGETAYDRCLQGKDWEDTKEEISDALIKTVRPLTEDESRQLLGD